MVLQTEVAVGWWVAEKGMPLAFPGHTEINEEAAKRVAFAQSEANPGIVFQVRYHVNANAPSSSRKLATYAVSSRRTNVSRLGSGRKVSRERRIRAACSC